MPTNQLISELGAGGVVGYALVLALTYLPSVAALDITEADKGVMGLGLGVVVTFFAKVIRKLAGMKADQPLLTRE